MGLIWMPKASQRVAGAQGAKRRRHRETRPVKGIPAGMPAPLRLLPEP
jgi:hypothetical protein